MRLRSKAKLQKGKPQNACLTGATLLLSNSCTTDSPAAAKSAEFLIIAHNATKRLCACCLVPGTAACALLIALSVQGQQLSPALQHKVDDAALQVLEKTGLPSAQLGIVQNGSIVYTTAYGNARLQPQQKATAQMHYAVGSISKQFTSACLLILQQQGKLTLDDPVGKWFPELAESQHVTIRNLLTHTSGYSDYAPQDYTIPEWTKPTTAQAIIHQWATKPLDFPPGTQWQYSNTNYNVAGLIVEKASGQPFWQFLENNVLQPLGLKNVLDLDRQREQMEPVGYMRNAFGPLRPAIPEAPGWYFADGEMAMPVSDLLTWDISILKQSLLSRKAYTELVTEFKLKDGKGTRYGLGIGVNA